MQYRERSLAISFVGVPVEARLFRECIEDDSETRKYQGPYPLHDLATIFLMNGLDPLDTDTKKIDLS
jgi:hypothetical protein